MAKDYERRRELRKVVESSAWWDKKFYGRKYNAKKRGLEFFLTRREFKQIFSGNKCYYCNIESDKYDFQLDRKNNNLGYLKSNVVLCCAPCNLFKKDVTIEKIEIRIKKYESKVELLYKIKSMLTKR